MARAFLAARAHYFATTALPPGVDVNNCTLAVWAMPLVATATRLIQLGAASGTASQGLAISTNSANQVDAISNDGVASNFSPGPTNAPINKWTHCAANYTSITNRRAYVNGAGGAADTNSRNVSGLDRVVLGARRTGGAYDQTNSLRLAHACIFSPALTVGEIAQLASGMSPRRVAPEKLKYWDPLDAGTVETRDQITGLVAYPTSSVNFPTGEFSPPETLSYWPRRKLRLVQGYAAPPAPTITNVDGDDTITAAQTGVVITGTNLSGATVTITQDAGVISSTQTVNSTSATTVNFDVVQGGLRYGATTTLTATTAGGSVNKTITLTPVATRSYVALSGYPAGGGATVVGQGASPAPVDGDQIEYDLLSYGGNAVVVNADGTFTVATTSGDTFAYRAWDDTDNTWSADALINVNGGYSTGVGHLGSSVNIINMMKTRRRPH